MTETAEPAHVFYVQLGCGDGQYIAADYMAVSTHTGIIQLLNDDSMQPVAVIVPHPGLSVIRVDSMITQEGLKET